MKNLGLILIAFAFFSCQSNKQKEEVVNNNDTNKVVVQQLTFEYDLNKFQLHKDFSKEELDTLLTDYAVFIAKKPSAANWETKFNKKYRKHFIGQRHIFDLVFFEKMSDGFHYFYLLRDASENNKLDKRGVAGKFKKTTANPYDEFEEIFVTKILPIEDIKWIGFQFMNHVDNANQTVSFLGEHSEKIEWPDGRLFYSKQKKEWRYVD
jgi:hypothetical protein